MNQAPSGATSSEYAAPTGLKFYFGFGSTNMPRRRRWGRQVAKRRRKLAGYEVAGDTRVWLVCPERTMDFRRPAGTGLVGRADQTPCVETNENVAADVNRLIILRAVFGWSGLTSAATQLISGCPVGTNTAANCSLGWTFASINIIKNDCACNKL